jgi:hypothetical protein
MLNWQTDAKMSRFTNAATIKRLLEVRLLLKEMKEGNG